MRELELSATGVRYSQHNCRRAAHALPLCCSYDVGVSGGAMFIARDQLGITDVELEVGLLSGTARREQIVYARLCVCCVRAR